MSSGNRTRAQAAQKFSCFGAGKESDAAESWEQLRARIEQTPTTAQVRGLFMNELLQSAPRSGVKANRRYVAFTLYPVREFMEIVLAIAQARPDKASPATAVMRTGFGIYSAFAASMLGTAIFAVARDFRRVVEVAPQAYAVTLPSSKVEVPRLEPGSATVRLREVWPYPDILQAGVWLGAMEALGAQGEIEVTRHSLCDVDFELRWREKA